MQKRTPAGCALYYRKRQRALTPGWHRSLSSVKADPGFDGQDCPGSEMRAMDQQAWLVSPSEPYGSGFSEWQPRSELRSQAGDRCDLVRDGARRAEWGRPVGLSRSLRVDPPPRRLHNRSLSGLRAGSNGPLCCCKPRRGRAGGSLGDESQNQAPEDGEVAQAGRQLSGGEGPASQAAGAESEEAQASGRRWAVGAGRVRPG